MMKDENKNIDGFFSARLQNETAENEGWNMPSDDIWNAAKPHFVDRKKSKKRFIFWLLIPILAICLSVPFGLNMFQSQNEISNVVDSNEKESTKSKSIEQSLSMINESLPTNEQPSNDVSSLHSYQLPNSSNDNKTSSKTKNINTVNSEDGLLNFEKPQINSNEKSIMGIENYTQEFLLKDIKNNSRSSQEEASKKQFENNTTIISAANNTARSIEEDRAVYVTKIGSLQNKKELILSIEEDTDIKNELEIESFNYKIIQPISYMPRTYEVGLTHNQFLVNIVLLFVEDEEDGLNRYSFSNNYFNAGLSGRKWINNRWSLNSGFQYSCLSLDVDFSVIDTLDKELKQFFNEGFNDATSRNVIGGQDINVEVNIKDGISTEIGDILNIRGKTNLKIKAIQIPLFLDYHIYKSKVEYLFGMGVSLEYLKIYEKASDLEVYRMNELISESVITPDYNDDYFDGSIYIRSGMRFKINRHINVGLNANISLLELPFSGFEFGAYYRWN